VTNVRPTTGARVSGPAYREALFSLVGAADPLSILQALPAAITQAIDGVSGIGLRTPEEPGKWSILEVVEHLADAEIVHAFRLRMMLTADCPQLPGYNQNLFASRFHYNDGSVTGAVALLSLLRERNLQVLRSVDVSDLDRIGVHGERGPESIRDVIKLTAGHDLVHRNQIRRIKERLRLA
jgi:DinB superfamily